MTFAVLCPGQGAQHAAMFDLACRNAEGLRVVEQASEALAEDPRAWLTRGDAIFDNAIAQPLICIAQLAVWTTLRAELPRPTAVAGYSVGELACYGVCDALDAGALAQLARARALAMDRAAGDRPSGLAGIPRSSEIAPAWKHSSRSLLPMTRSLSAVPSPRWPKPHRAAGIRVRKSPHFGSASRRIHRCSHPRSRPFDVR